jgi:hypothetical protein
MAVLIEIGKKYPCSSQGIYVDFETTEAVPGDIIECYFESDYAITDEQAHDVAVQVAKIKEDYPHSVIHYFKVEDRRITVQYSVGPPGIKISSRISSSISFAIPLWVAIIIVIAAIVGAIFAVEALRRGYLLPHKVPTGKAVVIARDRVDGTLLPNVKISTDGVEGSTGASGQGVKFELEEGDHMFIGEFVAGYDPPSPVSAYVEADKTVEVTIPYNPEGSTPPTHGWLIVNTDPIKGIVYIDSVEKGQAPVASYERMGEHIVNFGEIEGWITPESRTITVVGDPYQTSVIGVYKRPEEEWWEKYLKYALIGGGVIVGAALLVPPAIRALTTKVKRLPERKEE